MPLKQVAPPLYVLFVRPSGVGPPSWPREDSSYSRYLTGDRGGRITISLGLGRVDWHSIPARSFGGDDLDATWVTYRWCVVGEDGSWSTVAGESDLVDAAEVDGLLESWWDAHQDDVYQWDFQLVELPDGVQTE